MDQAILDSVLTEKDNRMNLSNTNMFRKSFIFYFYLRIKKNKYLKYKYMYFNLYTNTNTP